MKHKTERSYDCTSVKDRCPRRVELCFNKKNYVIIELDNYNLFGGNLSVKLCTLSLPMGLLNVTLLRISEEYV